MKFFLFVYECLLQQLRLLDDSMELLILDSSCQLVVNLVTFHTNDDVLEGLGLHTGLLKLCLDLFCLLIVRLDETLHFFPLLDCYLVLMT